ncbi:MAG: OmpA family protein [Granulosicoccus sp.]
MIIRNTQNKSNGSALLWGLVWLAGISALCVAAVTLAMPRFEKKQRSAVVRTVASISKSPVGMGIKGFTATLSGEVADEETKIAIIESIGIHTGVFSVRDRLSVAELPEELPSIESQIPMLAKKSDTNMVPIPFRHAENEPLAAFELAANQQKDPVGDDSGDQSESKTNESDSNASKPAASLTPDVDQSTLPSISIRIAGDVLSVSGVLAPEDDPSSIIESAMDGFEVDVVSNGIVSSDAVMRSPWLESLEGFMPVFASLREANLELTQRQITISGIAPGQQSHDAVINKALASLGTFSLIEHITIDDSIDTDADGVQVAALAQSSNSQESAEAVKIAAEEEQARIAAEAESAAKEAAEAEKARLAAEAEKAAEEEKARLAAEAEKARLAAEEEKARLAAEAEKARLAAEEEKARLAAEAEKARLAAEAKKAAEEEKARLAAEAEKTRLAAEAKKAAEEEKARLAAEAEKARLAAEAKKAEEEKARLAAEAEKARLAAEAKKAAEEEKARLAAEAEKARLAAEAKKAAEEEKARLAAEAEKARLATEAKKAEEEKARLAAEAEKARLAAEAKKAAEEEKARLAAEAEKARLAAEAKKAAEEEKARLAAEAEKARLAAEARKAAEEEKARLAAEAEKARLAAEAKKAAEEEKARLAAEAEKTRLAAEAKKAAEEEKARLAAEAEKTRLAAEAKKAAEEEKARLAAEAEKARLAAEAKKAAEEEKARLAAEAEKARLAAAAKKAAEEEKARLAAEAEKARLVAEAKKAEEEKARLAAEAEKATTNALVAKAAEPVAEQQSNEQLQKALSKLPSLRILFESSSNVIAEESREVLDQIADVLKSYPETTVTIEGHTDSTGDGEINLALSLSRATIVRSYLVEQGVSVFKLRAKGFGEEIPIANNQTAAGRAANRRIEFKF